MNHPFRYFNSSPEVIRLAVMMYIRYPLSLRQVEDIMFECGIDICHETVRYWWHRFGPMFAGEIRKRRVHGRNGSNWRWHLDEVLVRINGERHSTPSHPPRHFQTTPSRRFVPVEPTASLTVLKKRFRRIESVSLTVPRICIFVC